MIIITRGASGGRLIEDGARCSLANVVGGNDYQVANFSASILPDLDGVGAGAGADNNGAHAVRCVDEDMIGVRIAADHKGAFAKGALVQDRDDIRVAGSG